jgi:hypothetical protein
MATTSVVKEVDEKGKKIVSGHEASAILVLDNLLSAKQLSERNLRPTAGIHLASKNLETLAFVAGVLTEKEVRNTTHHSIMEAEKLTREEYLAQFFPGAFEGSVPHDAERYKLRVVYIDLNRPQGLAFLGRVREGLERHLDTKGKAIEAAYDVLRRTASTMQQESSSGASKTILEKAAKNLLSLIPPTGDKESMFSPQNEHDYLTGREENYDLIKSTYLPRVNKIIEIVRSGELRQPIVVPMLALPERINLEGARRKQ